MRRVCSSGWWRRWRVVMWCCVCVICLVLLAIWDTLGYLLTSSNDNRTRHCPPPPIEVDGCASWRPLQTQHPTCACTRKLLVLHDTCTEFETTDAFSYITYTKEYYGSSHCSDEATLRGPRQHVVSLSLDRITSYDVAALNQTINQINSAYKGWLIRIYSPTDSHKHPNLCSLVCSNPNLDLCDIKGMSKPSKVAYPQGRMGWPWAVLGDPLISVWLVRYAELEIMEREAHAVTQFINSDKCWHMMKDHTNHASSAIGSGLLGGKTSWGSKILRKTKHRLTNEVRSISDEETILEDTLVGRMAHDVMTHDSVTCHRSIESVPFPSRRQPGQWVGMPSVNPVQEQVNVKPLHEIRSFVKTSSKPLMLQKLSETSGKNNLHNASPTEPSPGKTRHARDVQRSKSVPKLQSNSSSRNLSRTTAATSAGEQKVPQTTKNVSHPMDASKERDINQKNGIYMCPQACRPHLHPDWQYC